MRTIGLLGGGMSWEWTVPYYRVVNKQRERLGGLHSAKLVLYSIDFQEIEPLQRAEAWDEALPSGAIGHLQCRGERRFPAVAPQVRAGIRRGEADSIDPVARDVTGEIEVVPRLPSEVEPVGELHRRVEWHVVPGDRRLRP